MDCRLSAGTRRAICSTTPVFCTTNRCLQQTHLAVKSCQKNSCVRPLLVARGLLFPAAAYQGETHGPVYLAARLVCTGVARADSDGGVRQSVRKGVRTST